MTESALPGEETRIEESVAAVVREGLTARQKRLPPWLFYDEAGSRLFERITELPEYYPTRTERGILAAHAAEIVALAAEGRRLRMAELGVLGVRVMTCTQTPRRNGLPCKAGALDLARTWRRPFLTSWVMVGIERLENDG